jgi:hypothetical protein
VLDRAPAEECGVISFSLGGLMKRFVTRALIVVASILGIVFAQVPPASAQEPDELVRSLATLWTKVLETPTKKNPLTNPDVAACWDLGHRTVAPFFGGPDFSCTVKANTKLFVVGWSTECSNIPNDSDGGVNLTEPELRQCAIDAVAERKPTTVTLDGMDVPLTEVETPALKIVMPKHNILGAPKGKYLSVADGLVALLPPLTPGEHKIVIVNQNPDDPDNPTTTTTTIHVEGTASS